MFVVGRIMTTNTPPHHHLPQEVQVSIPDICACITLHGRRDFADVIKLRLLQWEKHSGLSQFSSVSQSCPTLQPHGPQHARPPCPSPTPGIYSNSCPLSRWYHPTISSSVVPFSSHLQSFPASGAFQMSQFFASCGQSIGVSASTSVLPMNTQDWSPLG